MNNLDTTAGSGLHFLLGLLDRVGAGAPVMIYLASAMLAYLPLLICASLSPLSITSAEGPHTLPFLQDGTTMFVCLVAFPCMLS